MRSTLSTILKSAAAAVLMAVAAQAGAATTAVGLMGSTAASLGNTFNTKGTFTDYYTFTIGAGSNGIAGSTTDTAKTSTVRDVAVTKFVLSGGTLGSSLLTDSTIGDGFSFVGLGAGSYTLAVTVDVSTTSAWLNNNSTSYKGSYTGSFRALAAPASVASPAPEPADFAMALIGLAGVGVMVRRRSR